MKIVVFGATGMVGKHFTEAALANRHTVRAFGRNVFDVFSHNRSYLELVKGGVFSHDDVEAAIRGCDAVVSVLGGAADGVDKTRSLGMKTIVESMQSVGIQRIVGLGGVGVLQAAEDRLVYEMPTFPEQFKPVSIEHRYAWEHLSKSSLDWTFVCPGMISDEDASGEFTTNADHPAAGKGTIRAGDLAAFMLHELTDGKYLKCRVGISN
jgi:putative NADH-flavin reductase